jgi:hypothetical protein
VENAGLRITVEVFRQDGSMAQTIMFDQRGLTYLQLLELQQKAVQPCAAAITEVMARWGNEAVQAATATASSTPDAKKASG